MAYATISHVQAFNAARSFTGSSVPNASQVAFHLESVAADLDAALQARGIELPIATTATQALRFLEGLNAKGAWARAERAAPSSPHRKEAEKLWAEAKQLFDKAEPPGLTRDANTTHARTGAAATAWLSVDMDL